MEILTGIVKNLVVIVVVAGFLELLLPDSSMRPFVRFTIGLFIIIAIINPLLSVFYSGNDLKSLAWDLPWEYSDGTGFEDIGVQVNKDIQNTGNQAIKQKVEEQINSLAMLVPGVRDLETEIDLDAEGRGLSQVTLVIVSNRSGSSSSGDSIAAFSSREEELQNQEEIKDKLTSMMKNLYGLEESKLKIKFEGG
ncbi:MAG: stage III sporulation protein AF [Syntrophomonadaceae bacterium]|nr:stage III sporulation protein AF [Syntrophomonadaceae bacterium]